MANFFSKLFGRGKSQNDGAGVEVEIQNVLHGIIEKGNFDLSFEVVATGENISVEFAGADAHLVTSKDGLLLDSFQIYVMRMLQNKFPDKRYEVQVDCEGFMESSAQELRDLAEKLKAHVLEKGGASYVRALPPRDRKVVHRHLAEDARIRSQSIGDGFCKKIKISLTRDSAAPRPSRGDEATL